MEQPSRQTHYPADSIFANRWSPRAFTGEEISDFDLSTIFEAARWAPSSANNQPWRFLYTKRSSTDWTRFLNFLNEGNRVWCVNASVLMVVISKKILSQQGIERENLSHSFDTGAAWISLAFQALKMGLATHAMLGFDMKKTRLELKIPEIFQIEAMVAIGRQASKAILPKSLQDREFPSDRMPIESFAFSGNFPLEK